MITPFVPSSSLKSSTVSTTIPSRLSKPSASAAPSAFSSPLVTLSQVPVSSSKKTPLSPSLSLSPFLSLSPSAVKRRSTTPPPTSSANTYRPVPQTVPVASTSPRPVFSSTASSSSSSSSLSSVPSTSFFSQEHSVFSPQTAEIDELHNSSKPAAFSIVHSDDSSKGQTLHSSRSVLRQTAPLRPLISHNSAQYYSLPSSQATSLQPLRFLTPPMPPSQPPPSHPPPHPPPPLSNPPPPPHSLPPHTLPPPSKSPPPVPLSPSASILPASFVSFFGTTQTNAPSSSPSLSSSSSSVGSTDDAKMNSLKTGSGSYTPTPMCSNADVPASFSSISSISSSSSNQHPIFSFDSFCFDE
ncbi:uncharacterized protein MONOS_3750 [Monocercomonoides exilis]|uniref:uncharacterized protein n=1 Tax=Monocercomonoides exilis TaxID=2049356 RepID=UPI00355AC332|nr:hypothetical protein MONOS_3750 [Monocercomonoides exilis]|eukprot:MONOS_3750.1-p1 / transcript=MONOS_3750.1 / gene=MONOS_3750 / organism=Monocercomonoides_exilis_PA203 / gene_product=unspecified product / transcript_product=unspecified product / location=Mono_scaffold00091:66770-68119(+) / protein_length=355 / sequence_SO=supercontig / SO=protein_coding / is_pseudo=false